MKSAVTEAKTRVYEKATKQFQEGNQKFQKVVQEMSSLKTTCEGLETGNIQYQKDIESANALNATLKSQLDSQEKIHAELTAAFSGAMPSTAGKCLMEQGKDLIALLSRLTTDSAASTENAETLQKKIASEEQKKKKMEQSLQAAEALMSARAEEVGKLKAELQSQEDKHMTVYARVVTENKAVGEKVEELEGVVAQRDERIASLRAMNEELLGMLEN
jgi:DNA repair exonuclease SbcCD ATPase subunit